MVSTFNRLTLDSGSIWNPGIRKPPLMTSIVGALGSWFKVMSCTATNLDLLRIMEVLRELQHCGAIAQKIHG